MLSTKKRTPDAQAEIDAWKELCTMRWGAKGPTCPRCASRNPYWLPTRRMIFKCAVPWCNFQYSVTTDTAFQAHKLPYTVLLLALRLYRRRGWDLNVSAFARDLGVTWKVAYVLSRKLRSTGGGMNALRSGRPVQWVGRWQQHL